MVKPIVDGAVDGINGTILAFGRTNAGKTHTMVGTKSNPGLVPMTISHLYNSINENIHLDFVIRISYYEIYNEKIYDLMSVDKSDLKIMEDSNGLARIVGCTEHQVCSRDEAMAMLEQGQQNRHVGATQLNQQSSRSHSIFRLV